MANYPGERPARNHRARPRKQRMFARREDAEEFLMEARREFFQKGRVKLGCDRELHSDVMRAAEILADLPAATLTTAATLLKEYRSARERRGGKFEEPKSRQVELSPRAYLGLVHEARQSGMSLSDLVHGIVWGHLEERSRRRAEQGQQKKNGK